MKRYMLKSPNGGELLSGYGAHGTKKAAREHVTARAKELFRPNPTSWAELRGFGFRIVPVRITELKQR